MGLFRKRETIRLNPTSGRDLQRRRNSIPDNIANRCPSCKRIIIQNQLGENYCCPHCGNHLHFPARERIEWLVDEGSFKETNGELTTGNPLDFPNYEERLDRLKEETGLNEAIVTGTATIDEYPLALGVMDSQFIMASMGTIVGEKIVRLFELATKENLPVILYIASGGARMQEGILSLMQMAKVTQAVSEHGKAGGFYGAMLTNPTTGGVTASFAMQADIILSEPRATIGFAGKRVIEQTIKSTLPEDFQTAESTLENGFVDQIVKREDQHQVISSLLAIHK